ncbi:hypothetical protein AG1IA_02672 [Rhizoctonia solani AG-1 IA]|uniref:Uncharacterized protein n=1 Tax=Thanatephorus cucumeris (strain AG1-IA) TaxID=983506 RepID=L8WZB9_THACA|nr:hypothetical protein AG1IA_02672 [Rhizoctonia solani AG-1 IA]
MGLRFVNMSMIDPHLLEKQKIAHSDNAIELREHVTFLVWMYVRSDDLWKGGNPDALPAGPRVVGARVHRVLVMCVAIIYAHYTLELSNRL